MAVIGEMPGAEVARGGRGRAGRLCEVVEQERSTLSRLMKIKEIVSA